MLFNWTPVSAAFRSTLHEEGEEEEGGGGGGGG